MKQTSQEPYQLMPEFMDGEQECQKNNYDCSKYGPNCNIREVLHFNPTSKKETLGSSLLSIEDHTQFEYKLLRTIMTN